MSLIDNLELRKLVACVIDEAIATVAEEEFNRLCEITNNVALVGENIKAALESLAKLRDGLEPEYNEWDALFYVTWYQPRQINLALSILQELYQDVRKWQGPDLPLHIIDVGCGALAVQFAMAILAARYPAKCNDLTVNGIDPSEPMKRIGKVLWSNSRFFLGEHSDLSDLSRTCDHMTNNCELFDSHASCLSSVGGHSWFDFRLECWIIALHASYRSNQIRIRRALKALRGRYSPTFTIVTSHRSNGDVVRFVAGDRSKCQRLIPEQLPIPRQLPRTTEWRSNLLYRLPECSISRARGLLRNPVEWAPHNHKTTLCKILGEVKS